MGLKTGDAIIVRNDRGEFQGRVRIDRVKPGSLQGYWPEVNVVVPAGCLDPSGVPDYNAIVEVVRIAQSDKAPVAQAVTAQV
jgi:anaerobic selenocysteine-containing dehydrogenase